MLETARSRWATDKICQVFRGHIV